MLVPLQTGEQGEQPYSIQYPARYKLQAAVAEYMEAVLQHDLEGRPARVQVVLLTWPVVVDRALVPQRVAEREVTHTLAVVPEGKPALRWVQQIQAVAVLVVQAQDRLAEAVVEAEDIRTHASLTVISLPPKPLRLVPEERREAVRLREAPAALEYVS